jgi:hypothetical protein
MESKTKYYRIPAEVMQNKDISYAAKCLYSVILSLSKNKRGVCWARNQALAEITGSTTGGVSNCLAELKKAKYVTIETQRKGYTVVMRVIMPNVNV